MVTPRKPATRVPAGRIERVLRFGAMAGGIAANVAFDGARRWLSGDRAELGDLATSNATAEQLVAHLGRMRGAAMKLGQLLSLEASAILPPAFTDALGMLRAGGDTMTPAQLHRILGREYGRGWQARFQHFDEEPVAAASIGQVHRVVAADGRELALKIQFPGVAKSISSDVDNLAMLLKMARILPEDLDVTPFVRAVKDQLRRETDYLAEAASLARFRALLADEPDVLVPAPHADLTTTRILAMDFVPGKPISTLWEQHSPQAVRNRLAILAQRLVARELFSFGVMQSDPNFANFFITDEHRLVLLDFGSTVSIARPTSERYGRLLAAIIDDDRARVETIAREFKWLGKDDVGERAAGLIDLILLASEPLRAEGIYDYGASNLPDRAGTAGFDLAFRRGLRRPPAPELLFVHRKLGGTFHLCARLRACVDSRRILQPFIDTP